MKNESEAVMKVRRVHPGAKMPQYMTEGAACMDLFAAEAAEPIAGEYLGNGVSRTGSATVVRTGLQVEVPEGWALLIYSRSGDGFKRDIRLANCTGIIDSDYRGEVMVKLTCDSGAGPSVKPGVSIAQARLVWSPQFPVIETSDLSLTERGEKGFGSTDENARD